MSKHVIMDLNQPQHNSFHQQHDLHRCDWAFQWHVNSHKIIDDIAGLLTSPENWFIQGNFQVSYVRVTTHVWLVVKYSCPSQALVSTK